MFAIRRIWQKTAIRWRQTGGLALHCSLQKEEAVILLTGMDAKALEPPGTQGAVFCGTKRENAFPLFH